jgi:2-polyprenyl-3-methyl-5-hydroxy-6-metoxy-1,4-benzoquinol methylase
MASRANSATAQIDATSYVGTEDLVRLEVMRAYNKFIVGRVLEACKQAGLLPKHVLDFGAGIGTLSIHFEEETGTKPIAFEIDERQAAVIRERGFSAVTRWEDLVGGFDCIFASNVLEHIGDDLGILEQLKSRLRPGGCLFVLVPAFDLLWTEMDSQVGHFRRYTRTSLSSVVSGAGMQVLQCRYCDSLGFFAIGALKLLRSRRSAESTDSLLIYDRFVLPLSRLLDRLGLQFVLGRNVYVVAVTS